MSENETVYKLISVTVVDAVYECVRCGRREVKYCADPEWHYCAKCGRMIIKGIDCTGNNKNT